MNSQNHYQLNFNPRTNRPNKAEKQTRYVTQYRNIASIAPKWTQNVPVQPAFQEEQSASNRQAPNQQRQQHIFAYTTNDNGYASKSSRATSLRRDEQFRSQEEQRKKYEIMKRVRELQDKVLPMVEHQEGQQGMDAGWQSRVQVKIMRLERGLDNMRKEWEIEMEHKLIELQAQWQTNFQHFVEGNSQ